MSLIKIILGSTRPNRFGIQPATWLTELAKEHPEATFELVDLAKINLPLLNEPAPPMMGNYANARTKAWAEVIDKADGYIFVTAEYNHSLPGTFKNAFDFLYQEWRYKPVAFLSYGAGAGGARAVEAFRVTVANVDMFDIREELNLVNYWEQLNEQGMFKPTETQTKTAHTMLKQIAFWADKMAPARQELSK